MTRPGTALANPTRGFFVDMLVRDISVDAAILDLIDNAFDAARSCATDDSNLADFRVDLNIAADRFSIVDNCGGIPVQIAENYAFRFGRPSEYDPKTKVGQFGIGLKRAVFRLGNHFAVESSTQDEQFIVDVDVNQWRAQTDSDWIFDMAIDDAPADEIGTKVEVTQLHDNVARLFGQDRYIADMLSEIVDRYEHALDAGLEVVVNGMPASVRLHQVLQSSVVKPEKKTVRLEDKGRPVTLELVAGIGPERMPMRESGWYIYCNGRLVVKADRTGLTGWGVGEVGGNSGTPAWHPQYARFRGFVFFISDYPEALPWTTTKTELDSTAPIYVRARQYMQDSIAGYAHFTNELVAEREAYQQSDGTAPQVIGTAVSSARLVKLGNLRDSRFTVPKRRRAKGQDVGGRSRDVTNIQYKVEREKVERLKEALDLNTNAQVGRRSFDRMYQQEVGS